MLISQQVRLRPVFILIKQVSYRNNPSIKSFLYWFENFSKTRTISTGHTWSKVYEQGLTNTVTAGVSFEGIGVKESISMTHKNTVGNGGSHSETVKLSSTVPCVAKPYTYTVCTYMAYIGKIEIGYTIHWKNGSITRGVYTGQGYYQDTLIETHRYY